MPSVADVVSNTKPNTVPAVEFMLRKVFSQKKKSGPVLHICCDNFLRVPWFIEAIVAFIQL